mmetsp:Transcript_32502/g.68343  ORF Transcript_32502/g.68343 Transcript_32502/m.68343 type:complete len:232 (+) Transcript_32502:411-1106(+)
MPPKSKRNSHPNPRGAARMQPKPKRGKKISSPKEQTSAPTIPIYADVSHMDRTKDLRKRDKTVLVKKCGVTVSEIDEKNYTKVETMDPRVEKYCEVYTEDLARRVGLSSTFLPPALTMSVLLNPLFGLQSRIIGAGLLKRLQYARARSNLIRNMQDILDRKYPPIDDDSDDEDSKDSEDEEPLPARENSNYTKAEEELLLFESQKRKKYRPTFDASKSRILAGVDDDGKKH